jgi:bifunctional DNA-binding transcriptional regulator/antitoxin component of YhaV-PrlF toxin-antitoxin module
MSKVTAKLQVTIPRSIARAHGIEPGTQILFESAGDVVRIRIIDGNDPHGKAENADWRLDRFDRATERQRCRNRRYRQRGGRPVHDRGWTREDLYDRGVPR